MRCEQFAEVAGPATRCVVIPPTGHDDLPRHVGGKIGARGELARLVVVGHDHLGAAGVEPEGDRRRREGGEQRHVHRAATPDAENRDHQIRGLAHERGDVVAGFDTEIRQRRGEARRAFPKLTVGEVGGTQIGVDDGERHRIGGVVVAQQSGCAGVCRVVPLEQCPHTACCVAHRGPFVRTGRYVVVCGIDPFDVYDSSHTVFPIPPERGGVRVVLLVGAPASPRR